MNEVDRYVAGAGPGKASGEGYLGRRRADDIRK